MNTQLINKYPNEVQEKVIKILRAFDEVYVTTYEDGTYEVSADYGLYAYAKPGFMECIEVDEVYDKKEKTINYINQFRTYPYSFNGYRNYKLINELYENRSLEVIDIIDGNLIVK